MVEAREFEVVLDAAVILLVVVMIGVSSCVAGGWVTVVWI